MTAQTATGVTVPVGSDGWNPIAHIKGAFDTARTVIPVTSLAQRNGLAALFPGGVLPVPTVVARMDIVGVPLETWDGSEWILPPLGQIATAAYPNGTGNIAFNFLVIIADVTTPSIPAGRNLRITLETDANMSLSSGIAAIGLNQGGTTGNNNGTQIRTSAVSYQSATSTASSDLTYHFTTTAVGAQRFYAICTAVAPSGATISYPANARRITVYDDGAA